MDDFLTNASEEFFILFLMLITGFVIMLILNIVSLVKIKRLKKKYNHFMSGLSDKNFEQMLEENISNVLNVKENNKRLDKEIEQIKNNLAFCIQKVGIVRFNAFENMGSDLSFAIALLDSNDNGVVISSIYSRESSSTYAKPIVNGKSAYSLSEEELQAINKAKKTQDI